VDDSGRHPSTRLAAGVLRRLAQRLRSALARLWASERLLLVVLTLFNLFLARRTFEGGIWADNDSVCHYAYLRHLLEEFYPATGTFFGFTPKYDLGAPFLLYNTPPGLYVVSALVATITGIGALGALKGVVVAAFLSVPLLGARLAATFEDEPRDLPKFVALATSLFSSELFGLEFSFKNGMLNPVLGVPLLLATILFFRHAQRARDHRVLLHLALAGCAFAGTVLVHLLTAYMLAIALACCSLAAGPRRAGRSLLAVGVVVALGSGLAAFWLVPSLPLAARQDAAFTWIRRANDTLANYFDGSMLSSYPVGFYPQFVTYSGVGIVAILCAGFGLWRAIALRSWPVLSFGVCALVSLLVTLGPRPSFGLWLLPMYDRLLWYRFATLLELSTLIVAGWGAWQLYEARGRLGGVAMQALVAGGAWAALVMLQRAVMVNTGHDYPQFVADVDAVSAWLRDHGKKDGRVFGEFLGQDVVDSAGVNYPRHMIPILSGFAEAGGWVYENAEAAQAMMKRGLFWYDPFPMIALAPRYDVEYIVAGSPNFVRVLDDDPRWRRVLATTHLSLYEAVDREPARAEAAGWDVRVRRQGYLKGGGYEYAIDAIRTTAAAGGEMLVKTGWSPAWRARAGDQTLATGSTEESLLTVALPAGRDDVAITLTWDITGWRTQGNRISLGTLGVTALLAAFGARRRLRLPAVPERLSERLGLSAAAAGTIAFALRAHPIDEHVVGFGLRDGMSVTYDAARLDVGAFDDAERFRPTHVVASAWSGRELASGAPARVLLKGDDVAAVVALSPFGENQLTVDGLLKPEAGARAAVDSDVLRTDRREGADANTDVRTPDRRQGADANTDVILSLSEPDGHRVACRLPATLGRAVPLPDSCRAGPRGDGPGVTRELTLHAGGTLTVHRIVVGSGIVYVEAEQMHNVLDDGGYEAFYAYGPPDQFSSNGVSMVARAPLKAPIALDRDVTLPGEAYEVWLLTRTVSPRLENGRAHFRVESDGAKVGDLDGHTRRAIPYWDDDPHHEWLLAGRMAGAGTHRVRVTFYKVKTAFDALGDLDALAFVPVAP
jgi:hypothetical protein